jgi:hypothetical protein
MFSPENKSKYLDKKLHASKPWDFSGKFNLKSAVNSFEAISEVVFGDMKSPFSLWKSSTSNRYFLVPLTKDLLAGDFAVEAFHGFHRKVNLASIAPFEITREEAKAYIQAELSNTLKEAQEAFTALTSFAAAAQDKPVSNSQFPNNPLATLLGVSEAELKENPYTVKDHWQNLVKGLGDLLKAATSDDAKDLKRAREQMQRLQNHLQAQGVEVDDAIQDLPDQLRKKYHDSESDPTLKTSAENLQAATQNMGQSFKELMQTLKDGAQKVKTAVKEAEAQKSQSKSEAVKRSENEND